MQAFIVLSLCAVVVTAQYYGVGAPGGSQASASSQSFGGSGDNYHVRGGLGGYPIGGDGYAGGYPNKANYVSGYPGGGYVGGGGFGGPPRGFRGGFNVGRYGGNSGNGGRGYYGR